MIRRKQIISPVITLSFNKHHRKEIYVLEEDDFILIENIKRVGPAVVEVTHQGMDRTIKRHSLKSMTIWGWLEKYIQAGVWALNSKKAALLLPPELVEASLRFRGTTKSQRKRMAQTMKR